MVTRALLTVYIATGLALYLRVLPWRHLSLSWAQVFRLPVPQVWRLATNFTVIGAPSLHFVFQLVWL